MERSERKISIECKINFCSLPSATFIFLVTLFIKTEKTIQFNFSFCFEPSDLDNEQTWCLCFKSKLWLHSSRLPNKHAPGAFCLNVKNTWCILYLYCVSTNVEIYGSRTIYSYILCAFERILVRYFDLFLSISHLSSEMTKSTL